MIERWLAAVRDHPDRPAALQRHALTMLALRLDWTTGSGFASMRDIAADSDASDHTVKRATGWARSDKVGLLVCTRRGHRLGNGTTVASEWQLTLPVDGQSQGATDGTLKSQGASGADLKVPAGASQGASGATHQESSTSQSSPSPRASASDTIRAAFPDANSHEIEAVTKIIVAARKPRDLDAYVASMAARGSLRLPCDRQGRGRHSEACRRGDGSSCGMDWCHCRCHVKAAAR